MDARSSQPATMSATPMHARSLIQLVSFIAIYLGAGIVLEIQGKEMAFYQFPSVVAMSCAVVLAFCMFRTHGISANFSIFSRGAGDENIMTMLMIYLLAGAFSAVAGAMGGVEATSHLGLSLVPAKYVTAGIFLISGFLSFATGTSMGTIGAVVPLAYSMAQTAQINTAFVMAAVMCGAMFGDNLSMISDTTIAATRTQAVELKDKFRTNAWIALPSAALALILMLILGPEGVLAEQLDYNVVKVFPYVLVVLLALAGLNVFLILLLGIVCAAAIGIALGEFGVVGCAVAMWQGYQSMIEVFLLSLFVGGLSELTKYYGGLSWLMDKVGKLIRGPKSASIGLGVLVGLVDAACANNTVAIVVTADLAREISRTYRIDPRRTASFLDIFSCIVQGLIPYGAQFLLVASLTNNAVNPAQMIPYNWYLFILAIAAVLSVLVPSYDRVCCRGR
ncbi:MAG: Na+/H+ antiporter NhaC family protein [Atopobiaceae bacterium]|jgi:Na+/H+ antiporter NhaC